MSPESIVNGWIPVKEDPNLQIKHSKTPEQIIKPVNEHKFQLEYIENETFQVGRDGTSICNYQVPPGKKFDVRVHVIITDV